jgi:type VI secretion system protein VasI
VALVKCKECGEEVSTKAKACPKCGAWLPKKTSIVTWGVLALILFAIYGIWLLEFNLTPEKRNAKEETLAIPAKEEEKANVAIDNKEYAKCAIIEGDLARLECFDNLAKKKNLDGRQAQPASIAGKGKWNVSVDVNPIDDSKTVILSLDSDSGKSRRGESVFLIARCKSNTTDLYIGWNDYLGSEADVLTRVGDNKAITQRWSMSTDTKATFHSTPIPFLKEMLTSTKMVAQVTPYNESPVTAIFNTSGLENAIIPLRETCNW